MAKKYLKNEKGIVRAVTSENFQLEKPLLNENYDINVHNRNMDKIDNAIQEVKDKIDGLELVASNVKMANGSTVEVAVTNNTNLANQALTKANEAFQRGDNVKTQLVGKLISEGLNVSTNNSFEELINTIALGKKFASGTCNIKGGKNYYMFWDGSTKRCDYVEIPTPSFTPKVIIVFGAYSSEEYLSVYSERTTGTYSVKMLTIANTGSASTKGVSLKVGDVFASGKIQIPIYTPSSISQYAWIAYE